MKKKQQYIYIYILFMIFLLVIFYYAGRWYAEVYLKYNTTTLSGWNKYEQNPILGNNDTGTLFDPCVVQRDDGKFLMYVSWRPRKAIAVSQSDDGINWSELKICLTTNNSTDWENDINRASVIIKDGIYHMWYTGQNGNASKIGYAVSENGIDFKRVSNEPVLFSEYEWEKESVMNPFVLYDEEEETYKMWYAAGEQYEPDVIAYATSKNGLNWKKYENNPIFTSSNELIALDNYKVGACDIHKMSNDLYIMFYIGYTDIDTARIFMAISKNGINDWIRFSITPVVIPTIGQFDSNACYKPSAIYDKENERWMLYYNGRQQDKEYIGLVIKNNYT